MPLARAVAVRLLLGAVLLGAYVYVWRPYGRVAAVQDVGAPFLRRVVSGTAGPWAVDARAGAHRLALRSPSGDRTLRWTAPAGVRFLLPALGLLVVAPWRPYWLVLWGGHVALGALGLGLLGLGVATGGGWFALYDVLTRYLVDAFGLGVAAGAVAVEFDLAPPALLPADSSPNGDRRAGSGPPP